MICRDGYPSDIFSGLFLVQRAAALAGEHAAPVRRRFDGIALDTKPVAPEYTDFQKELLKTIEKLSKDNEAAIETARENARVVVVGKYYPVSIFELTQTILIFEIRFLILSWCA